MSTLNQMSADRSRLNALTSTPWWAPALLALIAGAWVASPALGDRKTGYAVALVSATLGVYLARQHMGIRVKASGPRHWALVMLWLLFTLVMYSVALGLVSFDKAVWVVAPSLAAAGFTYVVAKVADRWAREGLRA